MIYFNVLSAMSSPRLPFGISTYQIPAGEVCEGWKYELSDSQSQMALTSRGMKVFFGDFCRWPDVRQRGLALTKMKIICKVCEKFVSLQFGIIQRNEP